MGSYPIQQPNGKYGVWSTIVDDFTAVNLSKDEAVQMLFRNDVVEIALHRQALDEMYANNAPEPDIIDAGHLLDLLEKNLEQKVKRLFDGNFAHNLPQDFDGAMDIIAVLHGPEQANEVLRLMDEGPRDFSAVIEQHERENSEDY